MTNKRLDSIRKLKLLSTNKTTITEAVQGSFIEWHYQVYEVKNIFYYVEASWKTFKSKASNYTVTELELFCVNNGKTIFVEYEKDDKLELYICTEKVKMNDISTFHDRALTKTALIDISENEVGTIIYKNKEYKYSDDESTACLFFKNKLEFNKNAERVKFFEFENEDEFLTVEMWINEDGEKHDREAYLSHKVQSSSFTTIDTK